MGFCAANEGFNNRLSPSVNRHQTVSCLLQNRKSVTMLNFICTNQPETKLSLCNRRINSSRPITHSSPIAMNFFKIYLLLTHAMCLAVPIQWDLLQRATLKLRSCTPRISTLRFRISQTIIKIDITVKLWRRNGVCKIYISWIVSYINPNSIFSIIDSESHLSLHTIHIYFKTNHLLLLWLGTSIFLYT